MAGGDGWFLRAESVPQLTARKGVEILVRWRNGSEFYQQPVGLKEDHEPQKRLQLLTTS